MSFYCNLIILSNLIKEPLVSYVGNAVEQFGKERGIGRKFSAVGPDWLQNDYTYCSDSF